jgi:hypothetical protein
MSKQEDLELQEPLDTCGYVQEQYREHFEIEPEMGWDYINYLVESELYGPEYDAWLARLDQKNPLPLPQEDPPF